MHTERDLILILYNTPPHLESLKLVDLPILYFSWIRIRLFLLMRIRIQLPKIMRIRTATQFHYKLVYKLSTLIQTIDQITIKTPNLLSTGDQHYIP
jgi:hypothetical protein